MYPSVGMKVILLTLMLPQHTENKEVGQTRALEEPVKPDKDSHTVIIYVLYVLTFKSFFMKFSETLYYLYLGKILFQL